MELKVLEIKSRICSGAIFLCMFSIVFTQTHNLFFFFKNLWANGILIMFMIIFLFAYKFYIMISEKLLREVSFAKYLYSDSIIDLIKMFNC